MGICSYRFSEHHSEYHSDWTGTRYWGERDQMLQSGTTVPNSQITPKRAHVIRRCYRERDKMTQSHTTSPNGQISTKWAQILRRYCRERDQMFQSHQVCVSDNGLSYCDSELGSYPGQVMQCLGPSSSLGVLRTCFGCLFSSIARQSCLASCLVRACAIREPRDPHPSTCGDESAIQTTSHAGHPLADPFWQPVAWFWAHS